MPFFNDNDVYSIINAMECGGTATNTGLKNDAIPLLKE